MVRVRNNKCDNARADRACTRVATPFAADWCSEVHELRSYGSRIYRLWGGLRMLVRAGEEATS
jgi:hypothetical protein